VAAVEGAGIIQIQVCVDTDNNKSIHVSCFTFVRSDWTKYELKIASALEGVINKVIVDAAKKTKGMSYQLNFFDDNKDEGDK
jgi:hypothetical protein